MLTQEDAERVAQGKHLALSVLHGEMDASQAEVNVLRAKLAAAARQGLEVRVEGAWGQLSRGSVDPHNVGDASSADADARAGHFVC